VNRTVAMLAFGAALAVQGFGCLIQSHQIAPRWEDLVSAGWMGEPQSAAVRVFQTLGTVAVMLGLLAIGVALRSLNVEANPEARSPFGA
jgi:hypothetical protein